MDIYIESPGHFSRLADDGSYIPAAPALMFGNGSTITVLTTTSEN